MTAELSEARLIIRFAANALSPIERAAVAAFISETPEREASVEHGITRGGVWMARQRAFVKMRKRLAMLGIESAEDVL
jgi:DNA-directed RNA polymerase specialized sigma24 family protein